MAHVEKVKRKNFFEKWLNRLGYVKSVDLSALVGSMIFQQGQGVSPSTSYATLVDNYKSWVYTSISKIANTISSLPFRLYVYRKNGVKLKGLPIKNRIRSIKSKPEIDRFLKQNNLEKEEVISHPFLDTYNHPNILDTRFTLTYNIVIRLELAGYCGLYMPSNNLGIPAEFWALPMTKTAVLKVIPDKEKIVGGFSYQDGSVKSMLTTDELLYIRYPNPGSPFQGMSPIHSQLYPYDIDLYLMQQQYALLRNKAVYGNIFSTDHELKEAQITKLKEQLTAQYEGALNTGKPIVTHSGLKLESNNLSQNAKDMMLKEVSEYARDKLISSYDVPPEKLGLTRGSNRATLEVLDKTFINECIKPKTMFLEEYFEKGVLPKYDDSLTLDYVLPETSNRKLDLQERKENLSSGYTTINEERSKTEGLEPVPWGDVPLIPGTMMPLGSSKLPPEVGTEKNKALNKEYWTSEQKKIEFDKFIKQVEIRKELLVPILQRHFKQQLSEILERLERSGKSVGGHLAGWGSAKRGEWLKQNKSKLNDINIDRVEEAEKLVKMTAPTIGIILQDAGNKRLQTLGQSAVFNLADPDVEKWLSNRLRLFSKEIEGTTFHEVQHILREGFREGLPLTIIGNNLKEKFAGWEKWRAQMISRTETIAATNTGDLESIKQVGLENKLRKFWLNEVDARETHQVAGIEYGADGAIEIKKDFFVGADAMPSPGNGSLAEENVNCRCTLGYIEQ